MEDFAKKLAINHYVERHSDKKTFPRNQLKDDYQVISKAYQILNESIAKEVSIPPSGEWLLDNFYIIEEQFHFCMNHLLVKKYISLPSVQGTARILILARELVAYTDGNLDEDMIQKFFLGYQTKRSLSMEEISLFPFMLKLALIHHICLVAERIKIEQLEKFKAESLIERIVSQKESAKQQFKKYRGVNLNGEMMTYIEYLIFSLKKLGRDDLIDILEEEIIKKGTTSTEIIKTLHFDMAVRRISMSNSILSLKNISRFNWTVLFEKINPVELILKQDTLFEKMSYETKERYLKEIEIIAQKAHVSEVYVANVLIELWKKQQRHIGFFLFREERKMLAKVLDVPKLFHRRFNKNIILAVWITSIYLPSILTSLWLFPNFYLIGILPISEIFVLIVSSILQKRAKPKPLMQMEEINEDVETMVIIPTLLNSKERVEKMMKDIEIAYLANQDVKLHFCLLGDASESDTEVTDFDEAVKETGIREVKRLNEKYHQEIFSFVYRKRVYNPSQEKWLGYERKRGMIEEFNHFLMTNSPGTFLVNTIHNIPQIKYIITIDADTQLILGSAKKLIGIMEHPLNEPVIQNGKVVQGYGLIQPKISISMEESKKSLFSKLFAGNGGLDMYAGAEFHLYQDLFDEAIFTGKGIFRTKLYEKMLYHQIPENKILSHDLIEGSILRTGFASNVSFMDGFPARVNSYFFRLKRWTRGDVQNLFYLFSSSIKGITKYQIVDNIRRSLIPIFTFLLFCKGYFLKALGILFFPFLWDLFYTKKRILKIKKNNNLLPRLLASLYRCTLTLLFLPFHTALMVEAISISLYRMLVSRKNLLEWTTAADSEKVLGKNFLAYLDFMKIAIVPSLLFIIFQVQNEKKEWMVGIFFLFLWMITPWIAYHISKETEEIKIPLKQEEKEELLELAKRTWDFFKTYLTMENHYLMPDNYQEIRKKQIARSTSSTNIGLSMLAVISAYHLEFISYEELLFDLTQMIHTIQELPKWQGHLYNWYDVVTKKVLEPKFISTVDSGNFVAYLYVVMAFLEEKNERILTQKVKDIITQTHFNALYDNEKNLFSIGYDDHLKKLVDSYYDLLASESRTASYIAICKRDIPYKHWFYLGRSMTKMGGMQGLLSWAGTMFEYFMPRVIMKPLPGTILASAEDFCIVSQQKYAQKLHIPWGISESAFNLQDFHFNYQYKAFGIPWLGLKRGLKEEVVVSPYSSVMAISNRPKEVLQNIKELKKLGAYDRYGFYESIDFTPSRVKTKYEIVKTYMAHHQALILLSINNFLNEDVLVHMFSKNPEIQSAQVLLEERMPESIIDTKEKKEKAKPLKYQDYEEYVERVIHKEKKNVNILSGDNITMLVNDYGEGYVEVEGVLLSPFHEFQKVASTFFVKDTQSKLYWSNTLKPGNKKAESSQVVFSPAFCEFTRNDEKIQTVTKYVVSSEDKVVLKELELYNMRNTEAFLELFYLEEVALSSKESLIAHPAYQGLFLLTQGLHQDVLLEKRFHQGNKLYYLNMAINQEGKETDFEVEVDPLKVIGRGRTIENPVIVEQEKIVSNQILSTPSPIVTRKKRIYLKPDEKVTFYFYTIVASSKEEIEILYEKYHKYDSAKRLEELAIAKAKIDNRFLGLKGKEIIKFHEILAELLEGSDSIKQYEAIRRKNRLSQKELWKFGISGDVPMILFKTSKLENDFLLHQYLRAMVYFHHKHIAVDLVILNGEKNSYEQFVQDRIYELLSKENASFLVNQKGGIHLIKETLLSEEEQYLLYAFADMIVEEKDKHDK